MTHTHIVLECMCRKNHGASYPYETLGVDSSATAKGIRKAYRHLILRLQVLSLHASSDMVNAVASSPMFSHTLLFFRRALLVL